MGESEREIESRWWERENKRERVGNGRERVRE